MNVDPNHLAVVNITKLGERENREIKLLILLLWLDASPGGLIFVKGYSDHPGLLEIKNPSIRRNSSAAYLFSDWSLHLQQKNNRDFP